MLLLGDIQTGLDATLTKKCRYINHSCMPNWKSVDVNINIEDRTTISTHVPFIKALQPITVSDSIIVHYNRKMDESHESELCECQTTKCYGLVGIRSAHKDEEKVKTSRQHAIYGGPSSLMRSTTRNTLKTRNRYFIYTIYCVQKNVLNTLRSEAFDLKKRHFLTSKQHYVFLTDTFLAFIKEELHESKN